MLLAKVSDGVVCEVLEIKVMMLAMACLSVMKVDKINNVILSSRAVRQSAF